MNINFEKTKTAILAYCIEDWTSLFFIPSFIEQFYRYEDPELIKITSLAIIKKILEEKLVIAGDLTQNNKFIPWDKSINDVLKKIKHDWDNLGRELCMYELVWFEITEKGKKEFEHLNNLPELKETNLFYFDGEIEDILNIIKPHGHLIGKKDINSYIRFLKEGKNEAFKIFSKLTKKGKIIYQDNKKIISKLSDNLYIIYRSTSELGSITIDIRARDFRRNIKLKFGELHE
jgi:hypothetical protein